MLFLNVSIISIHKKRDPDCNNYCDISLFNNKCESLVVQWRSFQIS